MSESKPAQTEGIFLLIDRKNEKGLKHWCDELERRGIPAVVLIDEDTLDKNCDLVKNLSDRGFEISCGYNDGPFWNEPYDFQHEEMSYSKDKIRECINKPMRIFHSKYFAYNEATLKVADELGIEYILARGTVGAKAVVYEPEEYKTKIISVSNVPSKEMGTGSLCDESLRCRNETPDTLRGLLFDLKEDRIILVAQTHLSGVKLHWWNVYQDFFDANTVSWKSLDEFAIEPIVLPNEQIPINTRANYVIPKPNIPLEQEEDYPFEEL